MKILVTESQLKILMNEIGSDIEIDKCDEKAVKADFDKAIKFTEEWMNSSVTQNKMMKINNLSQQELSDIYKKYVHVLRNTKLILVNDESIGYTAQYNTTIVSTGDVYNTGNEFYINVNCARYRPQTSYLVMQHEITHLMSAVFPLNPFNNIKTMFNSRRESENDYFINIKNNLLKMGVPDDRSVILSKWWLNIIQLNSEKKEYSCDPNELLSNIMSFRNHLNLKPDQQITLDMLKPFITGEKEFNSSISWVLICWGNNGFPDINGFVNNINQMAINQQQQQQQQQNIT